MLNYTKFKLSVNTMHPTLTRALIALSDLPHFPTYHFIAFLDTITVVSNTCGCVTIVLVSLMG